MAIPVFPSIPNAPNRPTVALGGGGGEDWANALVGAPMGNKGGLNFIGIDGRHIVEVAAIKIVSSARSGGTMFIVELDVVETSNVEVEVGDRRAWLVKVAQPAGAADALRFSLDVLEALHGPEFSPIKHAMLKPPNERPAGLPDLRAALSAIADETQPARGLRFALVTRTSAQKLDKTKTFTQHDWRCLGFAEPRDARVAAPDDSILF